MKTVTDMSQKEFDDAMNEAKKEISINMEKVISKYFLEDDRVEVHMQLLENIVALSIISLSFVLQNPARQLYEVFGLRVQDYIKSLSYCPKECH